LKVTHVQLCFVIEWQLGLRDRRTPFIAMAKTRHLHSKLR